MGKNAFIHFQEICCGRSVGIIGPLESAYPLDGVEIFLRMNDFSKSGSEKCHIWLDNGIGGNPPYYADLVIRAAHTSIDIPGELRFLSGPMLDDALLFAPPEIFIDAAWHKSIDFSPLAAVVALEKVRHTAARRIYMLGMDLYGCDQEKAFAHDLKKNAAYIRMIADRDVRVVLCKELRMAIDALLEE